MTGPVVVVGAGLSGLSAAIHLAARGREVVVVEARDGPGGCCGSASLGPYRFDTGPSVLTMPDVLADTLGAAGEDIEDSLPLRRLDPFYRMTFHDGSHLDVVAGEQGFRRMDRFVSAQLTDERLVRAHTFQALYVGLAPDKALAIYSAVSHMDTVGGVYFPVEGGMRAIPEALARAAGKAGAQLRFGARAERVETGPSGVSAVRLDTGERITTGHAVIACDLVRAHTGLLPEAAGDWRLRRPRYSPSCLVMHFGLDRRPPGRAHHTLHFGREWEATFAALASGRPQADPSLLVTCPSGDATAAPDGHATLSVLEPAPNLASGADWEHLTPRLERRMLSRLADLGYGDLSSAPRVTFDPPAWARLGHSAGTPFALDHRFRQTAWLRPSGRSRRVPGLHFAGMYTAPGVGIPPALISGRLAAARILEGCR